MPFRGLPAISKRAQADSMKFRNRTDAGHQLAKALGDYKEQRPVILALPRGGVPVAAEIAATLDAPLDLVLVRKIGVPSQPELAMGAVVDGESPIVVRNEEVIDAAGIDDARFNAARDRELAEIERRRQCYLGDRPRTDFAGRVAIVVDDGIATGATTRAALRSVAARKPSWLVLAVPVAPREAISALEREVDTVVCLQTPDHFRAIGLYYDDFHQVSDDEVRRLLARHPAESRKAMGRAQ
jgi:putative phosphoribosyl transferase